MEEVFGGIGVSNGVGSEGIDFVFLLPLTSWTIRRTASAFAGQTCEETPQMLITRLSITLCSRTEWRGCTIVLLPFTLPACLPLFQTLYSLIGIDLYATDIEL